MNTKEKPIGAFSGITKGEWYKSAFNGEIVVMPSQVKICNRSGIGGATREEADQNKNMVAFAGNLAQKINLEHVEDFIQWFEVFYENALGSGVSEDDGRIMREKFNLLTR